MILSIPLKDDDMKLHMDHKFLARASVNADTSEFAPNIYRSKHYKDKVKTVLAGVCLIIYYVTFKDFPVLTKEIVNADIPFIIVMGLENVLYVSLVIVVMLTCGLEWFKP